MNTEIITMAKEALDMFAFLATELIILFLAISYIVGVLQDFLTPEKIQSILSSKKGKGYFIAALLGSITPFCSCSTIPFLKGLLRARAGFGPMMVFLFASPLLNPVIIGLFVVTFGWKVAVFYFAIAMSVSVVAGYVLEKLGFERYVKPEAYQAVGSSSCGTSCGDSSKKKKKRGQYQAVVPAPAMNLRQLRRKHLVVVMHQNLNLKWKCLAVHLAVVQQRQSWKRKSLAAGYVFGNQLGKTLSKCSLIS